MLVGAGLPMHKRKRSLGPFSRACLKIAFRQMCVTVCGKLGPNEGGVAGFIAAEHALCWLTLFGWHGDSLFVVPRVKLAMYDSSMKEK